MKQAALAYLSAFVVGGFLAYIITDVASLSILIGAGTAAMAWIFISPDPHYD